MACMLRLLLSVVVVLACIASGGAVNEEACTEGRAEHGCSSTPEEHREEITQASLLQRVFRHEFKSTLDEEADNCTGVAAQGKCWHLSEKGASCSATCAKHGRRFSYSAANATRPLTPRLVGHDPVSRQEPWVAFECYVPEDDRFHTANANAAKLQENLGAFSRESCMLACPCGGVTNESCGWRQPPACAAEFEWKGVVYSGCPVVDHDRPWCQHQRRHAGPNDWSYCIYSCGSETTLSPTSTAAPASAPTATPESEAKKAVGCMWVPPPSCVTEFRFGGSRHEGCTIADHTTPWCSNSDPFEGSWSHCVYTCTDNTSDATISDANNWAQNDNELCAWKQKPECAASFEYKGVNYTGCADVDHPTPWCSHRDAQKGNWSTCDLVCTPAAQPASGTAAPAAAAPARPAGGPGDQTTRATRPGDACERHPEADHDEIGQLVTLDQAGYRIAAAAESPVNMKRFVCRVVAKIHCRVVDLPSLMAFVPFYSGLVSQQTYAHLRDELTTLCHAGGKWLVPSS